MSRVVAIVMVAGLLAGCDKPDSPNIVLIVTDTLRADHLSC